MSPIELSWTAKNEDANVGEVLLIQPVRLHLNSSCYFANAHTGTHHGNPFKYIKTFTRELSHKAVFTQGSAVWTQRACHVCLSLSMAGLSETLNIVKISHFVLNNAMFCKMFLKTLPKAQWTRGLSSSCQSNFLKSYHKFKHKSWSNFIFRISTISIN